VLFGGEPSAITGERREILDRINKLLAPTSDVELRRAERVLAAVKQHRAGTLCQFRIGI
jgi:hypothetical protein